MSPAAALSEKLNYPAVRCMMCLETDTNIDRKRMCTHSLNLVSIANQKVPCGTMVRI
jgi:hypothetical protein